MKDQITVWRNEFNELLDKCGENGLSSETVVKAALELEEKVRGYAEE